MRSDNRLNELSAQEWLRFTKTWFVHNPPRRKKNEALHPAKYPESMIAEFISFFTKPGQVVFDPFLGTGSTLVACEQTGRRGIGVELQEKYAGIARQRLEGNSGKHRVLQGDASALDSLWEEHSLPLLDFVITSPPYGMMLNKKGLVSRERQREGLDVKYSADDRDLGNSRSYEEFLSRLVSIFQQLKPKIKEGGYLVIILQNYMEKGNYQTLAWDVANELKETYQFRGERLWLQDNKTLYPYGYRYSFVPNVHHHYCLIFRNSIPL